MATTASSATFSPPMLAGKPSRRSGVNVNYIRGLNCFGGLKAHNQVVSLGLSVFTHQSFANVVTSVKAPSARRGGAGGGGGGALSSTCNAVGEIFRIAAIMNGLTLVGVAVGFVLLRIEAYVEEEAESE